MEYGFTQGVSGWRAVMGLPALPTASAAGQSGGGALLPQVALAASSFAEFLGIDSPVILVGMDTRPTSRLIAAAIVQSLLSYGAIVRFAGVVAAPEIMAAAASLDGFVYVTASHNPVEYNGLKFGRRGAVLDAQENSKLSSIYRAKCDGQDAMQSAQKLLTSYHSEDAEVVYRGQEAAKRKALEAYKAFVEKIIGDVSYAEEGFGVIADFNGGARALSIDKDFFTEKGVAFCSINGADGAGASSRGGTAKATLAPVHGIVPEGENLLPLVKEMERLHETAGNSGGAPYGVAPPTPVLGYMTDCDGDRGNIVYWDDAAQSARVLSAQEVFALAVMHYLKKEKGEKKGVAVNCATSGMIDEVAAMCLASVFRSEVGEANVAGAAEAARQRGYIVPIAGEGSNGGLITYPSKVRDPIMTVFALLSLLREYGSMNAALAVLPRYTTTGATEERAQLHIKNKSALKAHFKKIFEREWGKAGALLAKYGIASYDTALTNGTEERILESGGAEEWDNGTGGLKVRLFDGKGAQIAFLWMRASGTEDVFRVMCDVKGEGAKAEEEELLAWWTAMIKEADRNAIY